MKLLLLTVIFLLPLEVWAVDWKILRSDQFRITCDLKSPPKTETVDTAEPAEPGH